MKAIVPFLLTTCLLAASAAGAETSTFTEKVLRGGHVIKWSILDERYARLQPWDPAKQEFPVSIVRMVAKAEKHLKEKVPALPEIVLAGVDTWTGEFGERDSSRLYLFAKIQFKKKGPDESADDWRLSVVFLPDETIVEPKEYLNGREIQTSQPCAEQSHATLLPEVPHIKWAIPDYARLQTWDPAKQEFPVSIVRMAAKAEKHLREKDPSLPEIILDYVDTGTVRIGDPDSQRQYLVCRMQFKKKGLDEARFDRKLLVVFLPDESIVKPVE